MDTETTETGASTETGAGEGESSDVVTLSKSEWEKHNQTLGSLKRQIKDLTKPKDEPKETPIQNQKSDDALLQRLEKVTLKQHNVSHLDDIELARNTAKKWGMDLEDVLGDEDFLLKLGKQQTARANIEATSGIKGDSSGKSSAKSSAEYWMTLGKAPTDEELATNKISRRESAKIMRHFMKSKGSNKKFYND